MADALIPQDEELGMPSASQAGVIDILLPRALKARPDLAEPFIAALAKLPENPENPDVAAVRNLDEADFDLVSHIIAGSYFLNEEVNKTLKYPGQESLPYDPDYDEIMEVVGRVIDRGPIYVTPAA
ncbi:hypothetical protein [Sphingobium olei]|uniref:Gluconate 2-dehydrogenase subunit 3 family protein n=1 Tax=Sphingobium olei TaxID=420955 RepID=A0ABW3P4F5_9SPHN